MLAEGSFGLALGEVVDKFAGGFHAVLVARRGCHEARMPEVMRELTDLLRRAGLIDPSTTVTPPAP